MPDCFSSPISVPVHAEAPTPQYFASLVIEMLLDAHLPACLPSNSLHSTNAIPRRKSNRENITRTPFSS
ncbi:hypothetical protein CHARACLAT_024512 [Characodon lateralis]|uniref:Uncharacterized protein n=1 Tax=Characodon lateralis TaxID=208331 RepID=A0ABU7E568_9TELE|nr:hypothetical protein [Characodon lateralis]